VIREQYTTTQFDIRHDASTRGQAPVEIERIKSSAIRGVVFLENDEGGNGFNRIFESTLQESRSMRARKNPAIPQARVPYAGIRSAAGNAVTSAGEDRDFVRVSLRPSLSKKCLGDQTNAEQHDDEFDHDEIEMNREVVTIQEKASADKCAASMLEPDPAINCENLTRNEVGRGGKE